MKRPFRTGLVAGLLALTLVGAGCHQGPAPRVSAERVGQHADRARPSLRPRRPPAPPSRRRSRLPLRPPAPRRPSRPPPSQRRPQAAAPKVTDHDGGAGQEGRPGRPSGSGYFPNVTHAAAIAGVEKGIFADKLGPDVTLKTEPRSTPAAPPSRRSSPAAIDATYIGPNPAINGFAKSKGEAMRIVAGATSAGASLVVRPDDQQRRRPQGQEGWPPPSSATRRTSPSGPGSSTRASRPTPRAAAT